MSESDDLSAGVPVQRPASTKKQAASEEATLASGIQRKKAVGDEEQAGVPLQRPVKSRKVEALTEPVSSGATDLFGVKDEEETEGPNFSDVLSSPLLFAALVVVFAGILIVILSQFFQFVQAIQSVPLFAQVIGYACVGLLVLAFFIALTRLALTYRRLAVTPAVNLTAIQEAKRRATTRDQLARQVEAGYKSLRDLVQKYPIDSSMHQDFLKRCGMTSDEINMLKSNVKALLKSENAGQSRWIEDCERLFVAVIDDAAKRRVKSYVKRVGVKTAICPTGLVDSLIVTTNSVMMVEELCRLYGVRTNRWQSILLTWRIFYFAFVSAKLEEKIDKIDKVADSLFEGALSSVPETAKEVCAKLSMGLLKRAIEAGVNMALFYRLGTATIMFLRPIKVRG